MTFTRVSVYHSACVAWHRVIGRWVGGAGRLGEPVAVGNRRKNKGVGSVQHSAESAKSGKLEQSQSGADVLGGRSWGNRKGLFALAGVDLTSPKPAEKTFGVLAGVVQRPAGLATG